MYTGILSEANILGPNTSGNKGTDRFGGES